MIQVRKLKTLSQFRARLDELGVSLPVDADIKPDGPLSEPVTLSDSGAGRVTVPNRFAILPMERWDASRDGQPSELVERRWQHFAESGAGLVWAEATSVSAAGRANPRQLMITESTVGVLARLRARFTDDQVVGIQLTHSGRFSRPDGDPRPVIAYRHPYLDGLVGADDEALVSDAELDDLVETFVTAARLAGEAGFDFVDVKACHGYLGHELLSAYDRPGRYGGDLDGRTQFMRSIIGGIRSSSPELAVAVRLSAFDLVPHRADEDGIGVPVTGGGYRYGFGGDGTGLGIDLSEPNALLHKIAGLGVGLVCVTGGSPYYCPHVQRPALFPPSDGYRPPEDPLVGVARMLSATAELAEANPNLTIVGSGYSYLQEWLPNVAQAVIRTGGASIVGLGRIALSMPDLPARVLGGEGLDRRLICRTFSDCTTAPRAGLVSGCYPLDPFYKSRPERAQLTVAKRATKGPRR